MISADSLSNRFSSADDRCRGLVLGGARILVGLMWLANLHWKVPNDFGQDSGGGLYKYPASLLRHSTFAPFTWVTEEIILPNFQFFGWLTLIIETVIATLLLVGYRTKLAALGGAAWAVPIMLSVLYYDRADEWSWSYLLLIAGNLLIYASDAGAHLGVDGVLRRPEERARRALLGIGVLTTVVGVAGLFVARSVAFAGSKVALLGSDAGFVGDDGQLVRRWELKFVWFNPLWALLTLACGLLLISAIRFPWTARWAGAGLALLSVTIFVTRTFDYVRDDGSVQTVATASNAALWGGLALAVLLLDAAIRAGAPGDPAIRAGAPGDPAIRSGSGA